MSTKNTFLQNELLEWAKYNLREFPWRKDSLSSYELVIAEVLLQRTKASTVSKYYNSFIDEYPNWDSLNNVGKSDLENKLTPLGLYKQKAKRLKALAKYMKNRSVGLPDSRDKLESIPLIGQYIASAVLVYVYDKKEPLLDVNMARLLERYFEPREKVDIRYDNKLHSFANNLVDHPKFKILNWAVIDFASAICTKTNPDCTNCPLKNKCTYYTPS